MGDDKPANPPEVMVEAMANEGPDHKTPSDGAEGNGKNRRDVPGDLHLSLDTAEHPAAVVSCGLLVPVNFPPDCAPDFLGLRKDHLKSLEHPC